MQSEHFLTFSMKHISSVLFLKACTCFWPDALLQDILQEEVYVKDTFTYTHMKREIKNQSTGFCQLRKKSGEISDRCNSR